MKFTVYSRPNCSYCDRAKNLLLNLNKDFEEINLFEDEQVLEWITLKEGHVTVPQIYVDDPSGCTEYIGGFSDLKTFLEDS